MTTLIKKSVLSLACLMAATVANAAGGHIYDIRPWYDNAIAPSPHSTTTSPMVGGDTVRFTVRMAPDKDHCSGEDNYKWHVRYIPNSAGSEIVAWLTNPLKIGIFVSGELRMATLVNEVPSISGNDYTDFIFEYLVTPGDFSLPIVLAMADGTQATGKALENISYYLAGTNNWMIANGVTNKTTATGYQEANFWFGSWGIITPKGADKPANDYDLRGAGFYVKTIDFDDKWETEKTKSDPGIWRSVHEGSSDVLSADPALALVAAATNSVTLHVWSDNSAAVVVTNKDENLWYDVVMKVGFDTVASRDILATNRVLDVKVQAGQTEVPFEIFGVKSNETANLVLSANTNYTYYTSGACYTNYVTVPVRCVEKLVKQQSITAALDGGLGEVSVSTNYTESVGTFTVAATTGYTNDLTVTVTPRLRDGYGAWSNYLHVAESDEVGMWATLTPCTFTIPKSEIENELKETITRTVYLYAMGADDHTSLASAGLEFDVTYDEAASNFFGAAKSSSKLWLKPTAPVITSPFEYQVIKSTGNTKKSFEIKVADSYKNICDTNTGYQVWYKRKASDTEYKKIEPASGTWALDTYGVLRDKCGKGALPSVFYVSAGTYETEFYVIAPDEVSKSEVRKVYVTVSEPATVSISTVLDDTMEGNEGTNVNVKVILSEPAENDGNAVYAFLNPLDENSSNLVTCTFLAKPGAKGIKILSGKTSSTVTAKIKFIDGDAEGYQLSYDVVLCRQQTYPTEWDESTYDDYFVSGYQSETYTPTIKNVKPHVTQAKMRGKSATASNWFTVKESGATIGSASLNVDKEFQFSVYEPGDIDLTNAVETTKFELQCVIQESNGAGITTNFYGNPKDQSFVYAFNATGPATVRVQVRDKDMKENDEWSDEFVFYVNVTEQPSVTIASESGSFVFDEDRIGVRDAALTVNLSENTATLPLVVELTVESTSTNNNEGTIVLGGCTPTSTNGVYTLTFPKSTLSQKIYISEADGTKLSKTKGFTVTARVISTEKNPDGTRWCDYYLNESYYVMVDNAPPTITTSLGAENVESNAFVVSRGAGDPISWSVDDIAFDLGWYDEDGKYNAKTNITVVWTSPNASLTTNVCDSTNTYWFTPRFENPGLQTVTVVVTDKDKDGGNGTTRMSWYYRVQTSKQLVAYPVGPHGEASKLTSRYTSAAGLGKGHIWVNGATSSGIVNFRQTWDCKLSGNATVYAWGYKTNTVDNGELNDKRDIAIDPSGNSTAGTSFYAYPDPIYDSFLYIWVKTTVENGAGTPAIDGISLERWNGSSSSAGTYQPALPTEADENGAYLDTLIEAVFSKEYLPSDNMGDINGDGLPDLYVQKHKLGVFDETSGEISGDDTKDISNYNADLDESGNAKPDYLPGKASTVYSYFIPDISNETDGVSFGTPFTAVQELRGAYSGANARWSGLNDACKSPYVGFTDVSVDKVYVDPTVDSVNSTLTKLEWDAWVELGQPADWSPECPTSPVLYDSDSDGLSDGFEYYYWYRAHVGYYEGTSHVFLKGRRFVPSKPMEPVEISSLEIEQAFNPQVKNDHDTDTDNDGLTDFQEAALGTNPFDFDTDGDGLPDGYEVVVSLTDPRKYATNGVTCDAALNPDGDSMACRDFTDTEGWYVVELEGGRYVCSQTKIETAEEGGVTNIVAAEGQVFYSTWIYSGEKGSDSEVYCRGREFFCADTYTKPGVVGEVAQKDMRVLHFHVYQMFEFDPRTGWNKTPYTTGHLIDSTPFTTRDEFLLQAFFLYAGGLTADEVDRSGEELTTRWLNQTTMPVMERTMESGEDTKTYYGADTDGDGMPDGWELYVMAGPRTEPDKPITEATDVDPLVVTIQAASVTVRVGVAPDSPYGPLQDYAEIAGTREANVNIKKYDAVGGDNLNWPEEFSGIESVGVYTNKCLSITLLHPEWKNKWWPTDPWNCDTDGDGLSDSEELKYFVYGSNPVAEDYDFHNVAGGGLNPLSWDTDFDGLPDPWEAEFAGTYSEGTSSQRTEVTTDGTTNVVTEITGAGWQEDGMDGTTDDWLKDYDHDGLANWQEYMVGAMRCWRYDDTVSPWTSHKTPQAVAKDGFIKLEGLTDDDLYAMLEGTWTDGYNPGMRNQHFDLGAYFSCANNAFEIGNWCTLTVNKRSVLPYGRFYMLRDGIYHDLSRDYNDDGDNRYTATVNRDESNPGKAGSGNSYSAYTSTGKGAYPLKYICCDPRLADTDYDGLDDYYEIFHGMNPLLGADRQTAELTNPPRDVVFEAYYDEVRVPSPWSALRNYWLDLSGVRNLTRPERAIAVKGDNTYDFFQFPWLNGLAAADPDGDNIRNQQEGIMANMQAAATYLHTDPTPLWMTDTSYEDSLTYRYYQVRDPSWASAGNVNYFDWSSEYFTYGGVQYPLSKYPWLTPVYVMGAIVGYTVNYESQFNYWCVADTFFDFEEDEGFDSDHDFLGDFEESQGKTKSASDPQYHDDPLRRQAMWFGGDEDKGFLETPTPVSEIVPTSTSMAEARQNFLYFTVECWAKADPATVGLEKRQTLVERAIWTGPAGAADEKYLRKNFLIGIQGGKWYAMFDSTGVDKLQAVEITEGPVATTNWTHVAATYDGTALKLYVDGVCRVTKETSIQPEHGVMATKVTEAAELDQAGTLAWNEGTFISMLVGASARSQKGIMFDYQWQSRRVKDVDGENRMVLGEVTTVADYDSFYRGYIDEVRVWDGARSAADILSDCQNRTRYTSALAQANREEVYAAWKKGALRSPAASGELPPELMYHWSFDHIAGAVTATDTVSSPAGFATDKTKTDAMAIWQRPEGWTNYWRCAVDDSIRSRVYDNLAWIPWINDTVGHLPRYDQTTVDSVYWSANYAGITPAAAVGSGYSSLTFPRSAELPSRRHQMGYTVSIGGENTPWCGNTRWELAKNTSEMRSAYRFAHRNRELDGFDLLPFGGAFPKRISATEGGMWDDGTPADAWAQTGADSNHDGLPNWWWDYASENYRIGDPSAALGWNTIVNYNGIRMAAYQAFKRDLAKGMLTDCKYHDEYKDTRDLDGDGMPDWWEELYGIDTGSKADAAGDPDHDGLSNLQEYKASEVDGRYLLNPTLANSIADANEVDYFLVITNGTTHLGEYLGEVYADHDFMEDDNEDDAGLDRTLYDAYSDADEDGWTAFAEMRYSTFKMGISQKFLSHLVGEEEVKDFPTPVIHATLRYNGDKVLSASNASIVVSAYTGNNLQKEANATFRITPGATQTRTQLLGAYSDRTIHGTLTPGNVIAGEDKISLQVLFVQSDDVFTWTINTNATFTGTYAEMYAAYTQYGDSFALASEELKWADLIANGVISYTDSANNALQVSLNADSQTGYFLLMGKRAGEIDFTTGDFTLNLSALADLNMEGTKVSLQQYFFRLKYNSMIPTLQTKSLSVSLATPDTGALTEGTTAFSAYMDLDGDGYTPEKDPIGFVKGVEIGWDQVPELVIEMTDSSQAAGQRFSFGDDVETLRIIRTTLNGEETLNGTDVKRRIVYSRTASEVARKNVYEADLVSSGKFGLDWTNLRKDIEAMSGTSVKDITSVGYTIVSGAGSVLNIDPETVITNFTVDYSAEATAATCVAPSAQKLGIVETARPTFRWTAPDGYTAFRLQIGDKTGTDWFWSSDLQVLPPKNTSGEYLWTAPVFIGTNVTGEAAVLENGSNYTWRVALYNAKFSKTNDVESSWSAKAAFQTRLAQANDLSTTYGSATVTVKYFGPATNGLDTVIVQLFRTADFTGTPAAQTRLYETNGLAKGLATAPQTVTLSGLSAGDYYAVAFVDRNGNGTRDRYETWGYAAQVGLSLQAIWTPSALAVDPTSAKIPSVTVYMEDTDINQDDVLDWDQDIATYFGTASSETGTDTSDVDGDGLSADREISDTYTDSQKWDTDGDGMPDGWENWNAQTDPLDPDADTVVDGDVMAYVEVARIRVTDKDGHTYLLNPTNANVQVGDDLGYDQLQATYDYVTVIGSGTNAVTKTLCGVGTNLNAVAGEKFRVQKKEDVTAVLVHAQVYDAYGYDMNTCVPGNGAVNTKPFSAIDKYMLIRYLTAIGVSATNAVPMTETAMNKGGLWADWTLKPGETDCDYDGMADGWELYMMFGTNKVSAASNCATPAAAPISPWNYDDARALSPGGEMTNLEEYHGGDMPTDPWDPKSLYEILKAKGILLPGTPEFADNEARRFRLGVDEYELDDDNDLIANLNEFQAYLLDRASLDDLSATNAWSNGSTPDYFRMGTNRNYKSVYGDRFYLGQVFNGGEFIEPWMRERLGMTAGGLANAGTRECNNSGWDYWSVARRMLTGKYDIDDLTNAEKLDIICQYLQLASMSSFTGSTLDEVHTWIEENDDKYGKVVSGMDTQQKLHGITVDETAVYLATVLNIDYDPDESGKDIYAFMQRYVENENRDVIEYPEVSIDLTLKYIGTVSNQLTLVAYQVNPADPDNGEQIAAQWNINPFFDMGVAKITLESASSGSLKQGSARFVAYIDNDGDGVYSAADTVGTASAYVGYLGCDLTISLGDPNPALPVLRTDASNGWSTVALVRTKVNGEPLYNDVRGVMWFSLDNNQAREALYPAEYAQGDHSGLDRYLAGDYEGSLENVESVTYEVLRIRREQIDPESRISVTNLNNYVIVSNGVFQFYTQDANEEFTIRYANTRDIAGVIADAGATEDDITLSFTVPMVDTAVTRFWVAVLTNGAEKAAVHGGQNGFLASAIAANGESSGVVTLDDAWLRENRIAFAAGATKVWIALGNDKYGRPADVPSEDAQTGDWSAAAKFVVNAKAARLGKLTVRVAHPVTNDLGGVTVALYEAADLANPVACRTGVVTGTDVTFDNLRNGESYYVAAWHVKNAADGRADAKYRQPYDTWGYFCKLDVLGNSCLAESNGFDAVSITATAANETTNTVWMQDTDWNDNGVADRLEDFLGVDGTYACAITVNRSFEISGATQSGGETAKSDVGVMAYAEVAYTVLEGSDGQLYAVVGTPSGPDVSTVGISVGTPIAELVSPDCEIASVYQYNRGGSGKAVYGLGRATYVPAGVTVDKVTTRNLVLVHAQVYDEFGFNPNTANGLISSVEWVNSKTFTGADKSYVTNYLANVLGFDNANAYVLDDDTDDSDGDGIQDGWELYTMFGAKGIAGGELQLSPWNYADRNWDADDDGLSNLLEYDGGYCPTDPSNKVTEDDGITDYFLRQYHLKGDDAGRDADGDGLSNYAEYLISEVFQYVKLDPDDPKTDGSCVDYFRKMGELYLGEIFTDHDQADDVWEESFSDAADDGKAFANRHVYDPGRDADKDGWSNYAEAKVGTNPELASTVGIDGYTYAEHPIPMIEASVTYNGKRNGIVAPLVFKAWNASFDSDMTSDPDAIWTVAASSSTSESSSSDSSSSTSTKDRAKYLGKNPCVARSFTLGPGAVAPGTVRVYFRDQGWEYAAVKNGTELAAYPGDSAQAKWYALVQDSSDGILVTCVTNETTSVRVGTVDYTTGRITLDLGDDSLTRSVYARVVNATDDNTNTGTDKNYISKYYNCEKLDLSESYVKVEWTSTVVGTTVDGKYYLGDADAVTASKPSRGYVREGKAKFVVFADQDGNGEYSAGEPFGFVQGVDIGWQGAKFSVNLTDTHPVFARISLVDGSNDRSNWAAMSSTIKTNRTGASSMPDGNVRVRVVRTAVNSVSVADLDGQAKVVMDKTFNKSVRSYLHEGDFLNGQDFDIDWDELADDAPVYKTKKYWPFGITNVTYSIVFGDGEITAGNSITQRTFVCSVDRVFDAQFPDNNRTGYVPLPYLADHGMVQTYNTRPVFRWFISDGQFNYNTYTAFRIEVFDQSGTTPIYDSDIQPMPGHTTVDGIDYYEWVAPSIVDNLSKSGGRISRNGTFTWRVTVYNALYDEDAGKTSGLGDLVTAVNVTQDANDHACSAVPVCVKYAGPSAVLAKAADLYDVLGKVRVQAFTSADFSGAPLSEALVTDDLADLSKTTANGKVYGLPATGTYYLRAYIDSNGNGSKDDWESWGAAANGVEAGGKTPVGIWIEDADTDDDWLPDAWEFANAGWDDCGYWLSLKNNKAKSGNFVVTQKLRDAVSANTQTAGISSEMSGAALTVFTYDDVAMLVCGSTQYSFTSVDDIRKAVERKVQSNTLKITSLTLDPTGNKIVLGIAAETAQTIAGRLISSVYEFSTPVTVRIYRKNSLIEAWNNDPVYETEVKISQNFDVLVEVPVSGVDMSSGFFKVEVEQ